MSTTPRSKTYSLHTAATDPIDDNALSVYDGDSIPETETMSDTKSFHTYDRLQREVPIPSRALLATDGGPAGQQEPRHLRDHHEASSEDQQSRRCGRSDWHPDLSSALFSSTGQQYGLGHHERGYLSGIFVNHLSY